MASVQEIIEKLLDDKITKLLTETRDEALARERVKWYQRAVVAGLTVALVMALSFAATYRTLHLMKNDIIEVCESRNTKERVLLPIFDGIIEANKRQSLEGLTAEEAHRRAESIAMFEDAREKYAAQRDCQRLFE